MWKRIMQKREVQRNYFRVGLITGLAIGGLAILGLFLRSEIGRNTRGRLGQTVQRVRTRLNGGAGSNGSADAQAPPVEEKSTDSKES